MYRCIIEESNGNSSSDEEMKSSCSDDYSCTHSTSSDEYSTADSIWSPSTVSDSER